MLSMPHTGELSNSKILRVVLGIHVHSHEKVKFILLSSPEREKWSRGGQSLVIILCWVPSSSQSLVLAADHSGRCPAMCSKHEEPRCHGPTEPALRPLTSALRGWDSSSQALLGPMGHQL